MIAINDIFIRKISKNDFPKVIDLIQEISVYTPPPKKITKVFGKDILTNNMLMDIVFFTINNLLDMDL